MFEAPIDMMSYLTLFPENWQEHTYITLNGVYENALLRTLETHENLSQIILCVDNDIGGIEAVERLSDILHEKGYTDIQRYAPDYKDWNEQLKAVNGEDALPAVAHPRIDNYRFIVSNLQEFECQPKRLLTEIKNAYRNGQVKYIAELAVSGSAFYLRQVAEFSGGFKRLCAKLSTEYRAYTDKAKKAQKQRNLGDLIRSAERDLKQTARTREQSVQTAKLFYQLADSAVKLCAEEILEEQNESQSEEETESIFLS